MNLLRSVRRPKCVVMGMEFSCQWLLLSGLGPPWFEPESRMRYLFPPRATEQMLLIGQADSAGRRFVVCDNDASANLKVCIPNRRSKSPKPMAAIVFR